MKSLNFLTLHLLFCLSMADVYRPDPIPCDTVDEGYICEPEKSRFWGELTPFYSTGSKESREKPLGCKVDQVSYLGRHGARGLGEEDGDSLRQTIEAKVASSVLQKFPFLQENLPEDPGTVLMPLGKHQAYNVGIRLAQDYSELALSQTPKVRTSASARVKDTARYLMQGFEDTWKLTVGEKHNIWILKDPEIVPGLLAVPEGYIGEFDTEYEREIDAYVDEVRQWHNKDLKNALGIDGVKFLDMDTNTVMGQLSAFCILGTFAYRKSMSIGPWCDLFSPAYFRKLVDYPISVEYWYDGGPSKPRIPRNVISWIKELHDRLLSQTPSDEAFVVDITHIENLQPTYVALGLFDHLKRPSLKQYTPPEEMDGWTPAPLCGRLIIERLQCDDWDGSFVRILLNDGVRTIATLSNRRTPGPGLYFVEDFLEHVSQTLEKVGVTLSEWKDDDNTAPEDSEDSDDTWEHPNERDSAIEKADASPVDKAGENS